MALAATGQTNDDVAVVVNDTHESIGGDPLEMEESAAAILKWPTATFPFLGAAHKLDCGGGSCRSPTNERAGIKQGESYVCVCVCVM